MIVDDCMSGQGQIQIGRAGWQPTHFAQVFNQNQIRIKNQIKKDNQNQPILHRFSTKIETISKSFLLLQFSKSSVL